MRLLSAVHTRRAVTLTEIMVVVSIIITLTSLAFYGFTYAKNFTDKMDADTRAAVALVNSHSNGTPIVATAAETRPPAPRPERIRGEYYVAFNARVSDPGATAQRLANLVGGRVLSVFTNVIYGFGLQCDDARIAQISADPDVQFVDQARYTYPCQTPNNIKRLYCNGINGSQKTPPTTTIMYGVPTSIYVMARNSSVRGIVNTRIYLSGTGASSTVAILDTGIDNTHPDLNVVAAMDFTGGNNPQDLNGHGTHVAGVVGALDATATGGVIGVYPGAPLINLKVMGNIAANDGLGAGSNLAVYSALANYVIPNSQFIRVCLMPFMTTPADPVMNTLVDAAANRGVLMVAAAGSGPVAILGAPGVSPASASQAIVVVSMIDTDGLAGALGAAGDDTLTVNNNTGRADFAAPGGGAAPAYFIRSTIPVARAIQLGITPYSPLVNGTAGNNAAGTSFAAAHVAGQLGLMTDPQTTLGFVVGNRAVPTFRPQMVNRTGAINGLFSATHQSASIQFISPLTGSAWVVSGTIPRFVTPYSKTLFNDRAGGVPVPNFYVNPGQAPSFLAVFPG